MEYIIGIDAGASKSELIAYDLNFNPIYKNIGAYGNPSVSLDSTINNITQLIEETLIDLQEKKCILMAIGMSGIESGNFHDMIKGYLDKRFCIDSLLLNDVVMATKAYLGRENGILTIAGTGSSTYWQRDGKGDMVGGWGHVLGDKGSGYHTVIEGFKRIVYQMDQGLPLDRLSRRLMEAIDARTAADLKGFIYSNEKVVIASLFPILVREGEGGNRAAQDLLKNAGSYLAEESLLAYRKFEDKEEIKIGIKGGVFHNSDLVYSTYEAIVKEKIENFTLIKEDIPVTEAVCQIYNERRLESYI